MTRDEAKAAARAAGFHGDRDALTHIYRAVEMPQHIKKLVWKQMELKYIEGEKAAKWGGLCECEACRAPRPEVTA